MLLKYYTKYVVFKVLPIYKFKKKNIISMLGGARAAVSPPLKIYHCIRHQLLLLYKICYGEKWFIGDRDLYLKYFKFEFNIKS